MGGGGKMLFQLQDVHQSIQWGRLGGNLGTSDTLSTHHLYSGLLKKGEIKVCADEKGLVPAFIPPFTHRNPLTPLTPLTLFTTLRIRLGQACEEGLKQLWRCSNSTPASNYRPLMVKRGCRGCRGRRSA